MLISVKIAPSRSMPKSEIKDRFDNDVNYAFEQEIEKFCATKSMLLHVGLTTTVAQTNWTKNKLEEMKTANGIVSCCFVGNFNLLNRYCDDLWL